MRLITSSHLRFFSTLLLWVMIGFVPQIVLAETPTPAPTTDPTLATTVVAAVTTMPTAAATSTPVVTTEAPTPSPAPVATTAVPASTAAPTPIATATPVPTSSTSTPKLAETTTATTTPATEVVRAKANATATVNSSGTASPTITNATLVVTPSAVAIASATATPTGSTTLTLVPTAILNSSATAPVTVTPLPALLPSPTPVGIVQPASAPISNVLVVDAKGNPLPLASQKAADILTGPDPKFCPGIDPGFGSVSCSAGQLTFAAAWTDAAAYASTASAGWTGTIYFEAGSFSETFTLDGTTFPVGKIPSQFLVKGAGSGSTILNGLMQVVHMNAVGITDLSISAANPGGTIMVGNASNPVTGTVKIENVVVSNSAGSGIAIQNVQAATAVYVNNVQVSGTNGHGIDVNGTAITGSTTIQNSTFNGTIAGDGVHVNTQGAVTLSSVTALTNTGNGVFINNTASLANEGVTLTNVTSKNNSQPGVLVNSNGSIAVTTLDARNNAGTGAGVQLQNNASLVSATVTVNSVAVNNSTGNDGLLINSKGNVSISSFQASNTGKTGVIIDNTFGAGTVTVAGTNVASNNSNGNGLSINSNGAVNVSNVSANGNQGGFVGIVINNSSSPTSASVTLSNVSVISNTNSGANINSKGDVVLTNITAYQNAGDNLFVNNSTGTGNVTVNGTNTFNSSTVARGLNVSSNGSISVSGVTAQNNPSTGVNLNNSTSPTSGSVTVSGLSLSANNGSGNLVVQTKGPISVSSVNSINSSAGSGADLNNSTSPVSATVNVGSSTFTGNAQHGLTINSKGNVTLSTVTASSNLGGSGLNVTTQGSLSASTSTFNSNAMDGILANTSAFNKPITLSLVTANSNSNRGATLNAGTGTITLDCMTALYNVLSPQISTVAGVLNILTTSCPVAVTGEVLTVLDPLIPTRFVDSVIGNITAFSNVEGLMFYSYAENLRGEFLIFVPHSTWKGAQPGEVIVNCIDPRGYNMRFSRLDSDRQGLFGLGTLPTNEAWYMIRVFAPDGRLVERIYLRLKVS